MGAVLPKAHCNRTGSSRTGTRGNFKPERWYWQKQEQVGSFSLLIVSLLQSKTRDPVRDPSAGLKHCIVIAHFSPRDTRLTASNKEVIMQQSCFCSITVSAFSALVFSFSSCPKKTKAGWFNGKWNFPCIPPRHPDTHKDSTPITSVSLVVFGQWQHFLWIYLCTHPIIDLKQSNSV